MLLFRWIRFLLKRWAYRLDTRHSCPGCLSRKTTIRAIQGEASGTDKTAGATITALEETCGFCGGRWMTAAIVKTENFLPAKESPGVK